MASFGKKRHTRNYEALGQYQMDLANAELVRTNNFGVLNDLISGNLFNIQSSFTPSTDLLTKSKNEKQKGEIINYTVIIVGILLFLVTIIIFSKIIK